MKSGNGGIAKRGNPLLLILLQTFLLAACGTTMDIAATIPAVPAAMAITANDTSTTLHWSGVTGAISYNIYWSDSPGVTTANGAKIVVAASPYTHTGLLNGKTYYYVMTAIGGGGEGAASAEVSATPRPPTLQVPRNITVGAGNSGSTISWQPLSVTASYNIYWSNTPGVTTTHGTKIAGVTSPYTHTGLVNGTTYYYIVTAVGSAGNEGGASSQVSATPMSYAPSTPANFTVSPGDAQSLLGWGAVTGAASYNIYWSTTAGVTTSTGTKVNVTSSPYTHTGLVNGTTYYYIVTAVTDGGESIATSVTISTPQPASSGIIPSAVAATAGNADVALVWNPVAGATAYNIYWSIAPGVTTTNGTKIAGVTSPYTHTGLVNGTVYYYIVTAVGSAGESAPSTQIFATPQAPMVSIAAGGEYSLMLRSDGTVWGWGNNQYGQLGNTGVSSSSVPVQIQQKGGGYLTGITTVAGGYFHAFAIGANGDVWAWGKNDYGQLGDGTTLSRYFPVKIGGLSGVVALQGGGYHSLALKADGTVSTWGNNQYGQLGDGGTAQRNSPAAVGGLSGITAVAAGNFYSIALKNDGTVWTWGNNQYGQLGGGTAQRNSPAAVGGLSGITAVAAGAHHAVALKNDGTVWTWGNNQYGQLGDGGTAQRNSPAAVGGLSGITAVAAGNFYSAALKNDGTVWTWGSNQYGQLGYGTVSNSAGTITTTTTTPLPDSGGPVQVSLVGVVSLAAGGSHITAFLGDDTAWGWGWNNHGQLGDGTAMNRPTPTLVSGITAAILSPTGVTAVAGTGKITISWTAFAGVSSYNIYWSANPNVNPLNGTKIANVTPGHVQTSLTAGATYYYIVTAVGASGESAPSMVVSATAQ